MSMYDEEKFAELVVLVAEEIENHPAGGAVKLNKVLFFAEFAHVRKHGHPISGARYQHLEHGPGPQQLRPVRRRLIEEGRVALEAVEDAFGYTQNRLRVLVPAHRDKFTSDEIETVQAIASALRHYNSATISDISHAEEGWRLTEMYEEIPYEAAFLGFEQPSTAISRRLEAEVAERHGFTSAP